MEKECCSPAFPHNLTTAIKAIVMTRHNNSKVAIFTYDVNPNCTHNLIPQRAAHPAPHSLLVIHLTKYLAIWRPCSQFRNLPHDLLLNSLMFNRICYKKKAGAMSRKFSGTVILHLAMSLKFGDRVDGRLCPRWFSGTVYLHLAMFPKFRTVEGWICPEK